MVNPLIPYLNNLLVKIEKDSAQFKRKSDEAMLLKPYQEWTDGEKRLFLKETTEQRLAKSDRWMHKAIDAEVAANELRSVIFLQGLKRGR